MVRGPRGRDHVGSPSGCGGDVAARSGSPGPLARRQPPRPLLPRRAVLRDRRPSSRPGLRRLSDDDGLARLRERRDLRRLARRASAIPRAGGQCDGRADGPDGPRDGWRAPRPVPGGARHARRTDLPCHQCAVRTRRPRPHLVGRGLLRARAHASPRRTAPVARVWRNRRDRPAHQDDHAVLRIRRRGGPAGGRPVASAG